MTKEQAIEVLNTYYRGEDNDDREFCDAIEMAIKALEQEEYYKDLAQSYERTITKLTEAISERQSSDDCVSRTEVIDELNHLGR